MEPAPSQIYEFDEFQVDAVKRQLWRRDGTPIPLTPRVFDTLLYLVQHSGGVLEKERLMDAVWPDAIVEENNLSKNISTLRRIFGERPGSPGLIITVPGYGYRFATKVTRADNMVAPKNAAETALADANGESVVAVSQLTPAPQTGKRFGVVVARSAIVIIGVLLLVIGALVYQRRQPEPANATLTAPDKSIAVLPFENRSEDKANAYFADGVQDEILTRLSKIADLKVISRTSTQHYKSAPEDLPEIARRLGVAYILEGSVQKDGDAVRVNVQLIRAATDSHLWADTFDRRLTDIFTVESEVAGKIANTLQAKLSGQEQRAVAVRPTENTEAYQLYLRGRYFWSKRTAEDLTRAIDFFEQAISKDPKYARAYVGIADCYIVLPFFSKLNPMECRQQAKLATNKALELDDELGEAHASLAILLAGDFRFAESKREFLRAVELNPNYANAYHWHGWAVLVPLGQFDEAVSELKHALALDPLSTVFNANLGDTYTMARRVPEAIAQLRKTVELDPHFSYGHSVLGDALESNGQLEEAIAEYNKAYELGHDFHVLSLLARAYALKDEREKALQLLNQLKELERQDSVWHYGFAFVYSALGDKAQALQQLEESYRSGEAGSTAYLNVDPKFDSLHGDPRFEAIVAHLAPSANSIR